VNDHTNVFQIKLTVLLTATCFVIYQIYYNGKYVIVMWSSCKFGLVGNRIDIGEHLLYSIHSTAGPRLMPLC